MMEIEVMKYERYARDLKRILIWSGLWPNFHPQLRIAIAYLVLFTTFVTAMAMLNFAIHHINNVLIVTRAMGLVISFFTCVLKVSVFLLYYEDIVYLNDSLSAEFVNNLRTPKNRPLQLVHLTTISRFFYGLTISVGLSCSLSFVMLLLSLRRGYHLMFPAIFPFAYQPGGPIFWLIQLIMVVANFFLWSLTGGVDSLLGYYTLQLCGELRVLSRRFRELGDSEDYSQELKDCVRKHHLLVSCQAALERLFGVLAIWVAVTSAAIQCTLVFQATEGVKTSVSPFRLAFLVGYIILKNVQAFTYAHCGQLITDESALCLESIYDASWAGSGDKRLMNDIIIVLSQRPLVFTAIGCMCLKMDVFLKILNTTVSYFFLLQTLDEDSR